MGRNRHTDKENRLVDTEGKERVGKIERVVWRIYTTLCKIASEWEVAVYSTGSSFRCSGMT